MVHGEGLAPRSIRLAHSIVSCYNFGEMELRYTVTDDDVLEVLRSSSRPRWALVLFALLLVIMVAFGIFLIDFDIVVGGTLFLVASLALGVKVYVAEPIRIRRAMRRRSHIRGENVLVLNDDGVESTFATGKTQLQWRAYSKYNETTQFFVLHLSSTQSTFIPKRVMSPQQMVELRTMLSAQIPSKVTTNQTT
jgi:hypothetical protein